VCGAQFRRGQSPSLIQQSNASNIIEEDLSSEGEATTRKRTEEVNDFELPDVKNVTFRELSLRIRMMVTRRKGVNVWPLPRDVYTTLTRFV
jgi:hypothetical protein